MKLIGLDIGDRRIGVAFGDSDLRMATPVDVVVRGAFEQDARAINLFVKNYDATQIVIGLPRNMDGTLGDQAKSVIGYAEKIAQTINVPLVFWVERLTTVEATRRTHETGARGKKSRRGIDAIAASLILQDYLDSQSHENV
jgi:putative Holliday junction resolvase